MILVISMAISALILILSYSKSRSRGKGECWFGPNSELEKFLAATDLSATQVQRQLLLAAAVALVRTEELEEQKYPLYNLAHDQIVSYELWNILDRTTKDLEIEKMVIMSEADNLRESWSQNIFREAMPLASKIKKDNKSRDRKGGETLFDKKRDMLEKKVLARIAPSAEIKA